MSGMVILFGVPCLAIFSFFRSLHYARVIGYRYALKILVSALAATLFLFLSYDALVVMTSGRAVFNPYFWVAGFMVSGLYCMVISIIALAKTHNAHSSESSDKAEPNREETTKEQAHDTHSYDDTFEA